MMNSITDFSTSIMELRYSWETETGKETWVQIADRVVDSVFSGVNVPKDIPSTLKYLIENRKFIPGGRFLAQAGRDYHQTNNCFMLRAEDTREGWGELMKKVTVMLMSGGGVGIDYSNIRPKGSILRRSGGTSSGPLPLLNVINEISRGVISGGKRRSALWAGLNWKHKDIIEFIELKNWQEAVVKMKAKDVDSHAVMDMTNISVILDKEFFTAFDNKDNHATMVYWKVIESMCKTGEPGFSIDYLNSKESLRNACNEVVSEDDCDACCLGSINLANISTLDELKYVTELGQLFLLVGTEYSDVPYPKVKDIREKSRRTGLGLMGLHEWLLLRGYKYEKNPELKSWLTTWKEQSDYSAKHWADKLNFNTPIAKRAIAPNGTTSIAGGQTTSGIEPIFSVAYQRRYLTPDGWKKRYIIDFVAEKLIEQGIDPESIEDAYKLSLDVERRINFQSFIQSFVDNGISSTVNLPQYGLDGNNDYKKFGELLYKYLPSLRGITVYPDGSRGGQPLKEVPYSFAIKHKNVVFDGNEDCPDGVCNL